MATREVDPDPLAAWVDAHRPGTTWRHLTDDAGGLIPGFIELTSGPRTRHLIDLDHERSPADRDAWIDWLGRAGFGDALRPGVELLRALLDHGELLPTRYRGRPAGSRDPDTHLEVTYHPHGFTFTLPVQLHDGGVLTGNALPAAPPTSWRLTVDLDGADLAIHEEFLAPGPELQWRPLETGTSDTTVPPTRRTTRRTPAPWPGPRAHLEAWLDRVRLLLCRFLVRYHYRVTDLAGHLDNALVSLLELQMTLAPALAAPSDRELGLPTLDELDEALDEHAALLHQRTEDSGAAGLRLPIEELRARFGLSELELDLVMVAAAGQLSEDLGRALRLCQADFTRRAPTLTLLAEIVAADAQGRSEALDCGGPAHILGRLELIDLRDAADWRHDTPEALRDVRVPARVLAFLQGQPHGLEAAHGLERDGLDAHCTFLPSTDLDATPADADVEAVVRALRLAHRLTTRPRPPHRRLPVASQTPIVLLVGADPSVHAELLLGCPMPTRGVLLVDLRRLAGSEAFGPTLARGLREALFLEATPLLLLGERPGPDDTLALHALRATLVATPGPVVLSAARVASALHEALGPCPELEVKPPSPDTRRAYWRHALTESAPCVVLDEEILDLAHRFALSRATITDVVRRARIDKDVRVSTSAPLTTADLQHTIHRRVQHDLGALAEPFSTPLTWDDLILPADLKARLTEMVTYARNERVVHEQWGFGRLNAYGRGLTALFGGPPGTGKTLAAAIMAKELGCELYRVDLSRIVDKYVGETEKNLGRVFDEAERSRAVLLFDEADSLFGKRTSVSSANDRYANLEVNYLLQRMEHFDGTSILTTNASEGIDDAFMRRIRFRLTFRLPDQADRERLWRLMLPAAAPVAEHIPFDKLAKDFEMAPAHIKNAVLRAAFQAIHAGGVIDYATLRDAAVVEYRELGNLVRD